MHPKLTFAISPRALLHHTWCPLVTHRNCLTRFLPSARIDATIDDVVAFNAQWDCKLALLRNDCRCYQSALVTLLLNEQ